MYNTYFGFKESPFSIAPDPRYLYMTAQHRDALAHLVYGLNSNGGCILLTGEVGTGKTTICRCLLEQVPEKVNIALVLNPKISELELLESICDELNIHYPDTDKSIKIFTDRINHFLIEHNARNEHTVLIIDEAQNLSTAVLEQLRLLTNLETEQHKLLQIIILGQPELLEILAKPELRQLAQRITARYHLQPLSRDELSAYINHRLATAGQNMQIFPATTIHKLYRLSGGIPRLINIICDRALLGCYVENCYKVEPRILNKAAREVFGELHKVEKQQAKSKKYVIAFALLILAILIMSLLQFNPYRHQQTTAHQNQAARKNPLPSLSTKAATNTLTSKPSSSGSTPVVNNITTPGKPSIASSTPPQTEIPAVSSMRTGVKTHTQASVGKQAALLNTVAFNTLIEQSPDTSQVAAWQQLFKQWKLNYDSQRSATACKQATNHGLSCLYKQGNLHSLRRYNRPAVLKLFTRSGKSCYATLVHLKQDIATLYINKNRLQIHTEILDQHWLGHYTLLWQRPATYHKAIAPGQHGKIVQWLARSIANIDQTAFTADNNKLYQGKIIQAVKQFQTQQQLSADGVVGPATIIHLNSALGLAVPLLSQ